MPLDPLDKVPLFLQLADLLKQQIDSGEIQPRRPIPSKRALQQEHGVSQGTAEHALAVLREAGYIETVIGKGMFVTDPAERAR